MAGRIFITGDTHAEPNKLNATNFPVQKELDKDDFVIICGDFGLVWDYVGESAYEKHWLDWLEDKPFTTLFCDGNHECFDRLYKYPVEKWHSGNVHKIRPSVIHLMRGQFYDLFGTKVFSFGGAQSHDIKDGILDPDNKEDCEKIYEWRHDCFGRQFRILGVSWWPQELPNEEEYEEGLKNLKKNDNKVDIVVSHDCPSSTQSLLGALQCGLYKTDKLNDYLEDVRVSVDFDKWYFGHYHVDRNINKKERCLYDDIVEYYPKN